MVQVFDQCASSKKAISYLEVAKPCTLQTCKSMQDLLDMQISSLSVTVIKTNTAIFPVQPIQQSLPLLLELHIWAMGAADARAFNSIIPNHLESKQPPSFSI